MSNRTYLLNTAILTNDIATKDFEYIELATASNRILIPWICCFRKVDLRALNYILRDGDEGVEFYIPCTDLKSAIKNLEESKWIFEILAGDEKVGKEYWLAAIDELKTASLPYLTIDPSEVFFMEDPEEAASKFASCYKDTSIDISQLKAVSEFIEDVLPYSREKFVDAPPCPDDDADRNYNSSLLDGGYENPEYRIHNVP